MGMIRFINNIRYLCRYNIKEVFKEFNYLKEEFSNIRYEMNHIPFEIEGDLEKVHEFSIKNKMETLSMLSNSDSSISRFGDGELFLLMGVSIPCQKANEKLTEKLKEVISTKDDKLMIGIPQLCTSYFGKNIEESKYDRYAYGKLLPYMYKFLNNEVQYYSQDIGFEYIQRGFNKNKE